jgi:hypothetical protein
MKNKLEKSINSLEFIFNRQWLTQKKLGTNIGKTLNPDERNTLYREHCIFTIEEIIEGLRNINHKPWKKTQEDDNIDYLKDELIDEFRFFLNRCILVQMSPSEFLSRFKKSITKTNKRIKNKY